MPTPNVPITVLMPVYNGGKYIREAIDSVLQQTFGDFEFLIVNDGSTDNTVSIIQSYNDSRIKLITQPNAGVSAALNTGLNMAAGKYIARFDADDICYLNRLELQYNFMEANPEYILIGSDVEYISENGEYIFSFKNPAYSNEEINNNYMNFCPFVHSTVFYRKEVVINLGAYDIKAHTFEDYFLWVKLIKHGKVCNFRQPLIEVRFNPSSVTVDGKDYEPAFIKLKQKALQSGSISNEEAAFIRESIGRLDKSKKLGSYNRLLAKKYLWNNYQPKKARNYLWQSLKTEPFKLNAYVLMFLSLLPASVIKKIYNIKKN